MSLVKRRRFSALLKKKTNKIAVRAFPLSANYVISLIIFSFFNKNARIAKLLFFVKTLTT